MTDFNLKVIKGDINKKYYPNKYRCYSVELNKNQKFTLKYYKCPLLKKPRYGCLKVNKKNKLVYIPYSNYKGCDNFILLYPFNDSYIVILYNLLIN